MNLRIATWNCYRGHADVKGGELSTWSPDVVALQECAPPRTPSGAIAWSGWRLSQGFGVLVPSGWSVAAERTSDATPRSARAFIIDSPSARLRLLQVWAHREPIYTTAVMRALEHFASFLMGDGIPCVVGDFNMSPRLDRLNSGPSAADVVERLHREFSLVSAYHSFHETALGSELHPTLYWRWKQAQPYHCDFCFVPTRLAPSIRSAQVPDFLALERKSDHRPVIVDIESFDQLSAQRSLNGVRNDTRVEHAGARSTGPLGSRTVVGFESRAYGK